MSISPTTRTPRPHGSWLILSLNRQVSRAPAPPGQALDDLHRRTDRTPRELLEMQYQFEEPFIVDSSKIANILDVHATPVARPSRHPRHLPARRQPVAPSSAGSWA